MSANQGHPAAAVLISGASKGIGRATALYLDSHGFTVIAGVRSAADAESLRSAASKRLRTIVLDITNTDHVANAAKAVQEVVGADGLDGLVNNAGIAVPAPLEFIPLDEFRLQIEVNLIGHLALTQALLAHLRTAKGRIINISSVGGRIAGPLLGPYHASKFAMEALTDTLRQELAPWQIHVVSVEPAAIATPIWEAGARTADRLAARMPPQSRELYGPAIQRARTMAERAAATGSPPEKVARVVEEALTARRPRTRYPVGWDGKIIARVIARLPDRLRDRVLSRR
jgi:NAD(P)-dependent dehydrogenase (short-subunit alcohol dehydrogenase family)